MVTAHATMAPGLLRAGSTLALGLAIGCWPVAPARSRLTSVLSTPDLGHRAVGIRAHRLGRALVAPQVVVTVFAGVLGFAVGGVGGAIALAAGAGLGFQRWCRAARARRHTGELAALLDAIGVMTAELRAGVHPAEAAVAAADSVAPGDRLGPVGPVEFLRAGGSAVAVPRVLASVAAGAYLGAEVPALFDRHAGEEPAIADELRRVAAAWALAERHGVALAELMDAVRTDLEARVRLAGQVKAQLAGPRSTAGVLAGLPLMGVLLGQGIGADPWRVLSTTPIGQLLFVVGTALACAGIVWSGRITGRAVLG